MAACIALRSSSLSRGLKGLSDEILIGVLLSALLEPANDMELCILQLFRLVEIVFSSSAIFFSNSIIFNS